MFSRKEQPLKPHQFRTKVGFLPKGEPKKPKITLSRQAFAQMNLYVEIAEEEVGWLGTVDRLPNGDFRIEECFLFKQTVSPTETEISTEGLSELAMTLLDEDEDKDEADWRVNKLRFWGHSHVRMGLSPSPTDQQTMLNSYGKGFSSNTGQARLCFEESGHPWVIRGIFNKFGEVNFNVYLYEEGLLFEDVEWTVDEPTAEQIAFHEATERHASPGTEPMSVHEVHTQMSSVAIGRDFGFKFSRDKKYRPEITPELRAAVKAEFARKVSSVRRFPVEHRPWSLKARPSEAKTIRCEDTSNSGVQFACEFDDEESLRGSSKPVGISYAQRNEAPRQTQVQRALWLNKPEPKPTTSIGAELWSGFIEVLEFFSKSGRRS